MDAKELVLTLVVAGILFIVTLLIFANIANTTEQIFDPDIATTTNESVTITSDSFTDTNSTLFANDGVRANEETIRNATNDVLVRNTDYRVTLDQASGGFLTRGNFTLINMQYNATALFADYKTSEQSTAQASNITIQSTVLDSFSLGVIALIVLAAVVILAILFRLGS